MSKPLLEKITFVVSLALLAFLYGMVTETMGWFPSPLLERAWSQAGALPLSANGGLGVTGSVHWMEPRVYDRVGARVAEPDRVQPGLTLVSTWWEDFGWRPGLKLIDRSGRAVHGWEVDGREIFPDPPRERVKRPPGRTSIHGSYLFPDGDVLVNVSYVGVARLDACGNVRWRLAEGAHHSISRADDGSFWITAGTFTDASRRTAHPGVEPQYEDRILRVSEDGEILDEIPVLDLLYANGLDRYIAKSSNEQSTVLQMQNGDLTHLNDVEPLPASMADEYPLFEAGDLVASFRNLDLVVVFDPESRVVKWHVSDPFIHQHDPDFMGGGWIGVFDNNQDGTDRGSMLGGSRIVAIQPLTDSIEVLFPTPRSEAFYTHVQGKWQQLANGNLLLTEAQPGRVVEVGRDGRTVWEWVARPDDKDLVPEVTEGTRYDLTRAAVAAWPCAPGDSIDGGTDTREESTP